MKFRRKSAEPQSAADDGIDAVDAAGADASTEVPAEPVAGPYDADELPDEAAAVERVDLGSIALAPFPGRELRLQVDESTGAVQAALLTAEDGALELRAFAAPRNGDLWGDVRPQLATDVQSRGGTVTEREGRWGTELVCQLAVQLPDGQAGTQVSRIIGINGPRWLLRATLLGRPAVDGDYAQSWEDGLTDIVVRRGAGAMPVGEALPLTLPPQAQRVQ
ncbi:DUF3710 domain-containing protein [Nocardioides sp. CER19]|uniref:DUF3710 domain-containing protein n=1 Tax=Nocardioides sp. CER19 TaxID=3038538 RepID=UPI002447C8E1|nr:DUF3710 domain-containing protein [Nocardioides sp. CER19]MDH2416569.1 DUF3710 domain-containing protein [Nocardioides sp. CER19]